MRELPAVKRSVSVILPDAALPWLSVARVRVNGARADFGHLARSVTPGTPTLVGEVTSDCDVTRGVHQQALTIELEIAGRGEILRAESVVPMDCSVAPPAPAAGCTAVPGSALGLLALAFCLRRRVDRNCDLSPSPPRGRGSGRGLPKRPSVAGAKRTS